MASSAGLTLGGAGIFDVAKVIWRKTGVAQLAHVAGQGASSKGPSTCSGKGSLPKQFR